MTIRSHLIALVLPFAAGVPVNGADPTLPGGVPRAIPEIPKPPYLHIHLIAVPQMEESLRRAIGEAHRRDTRRINFRENWRGYSWQGRFASFVMDEPYLLAAARYVEWNPVRARPTVTVRRSAASAFSAISCSSRRARASA